jgi:tRNA threonylcarbamoyladenosine biosynthesis protein TsaE
MEKSTWSSRGGGNILPTANLTILSAGPLETQNIGRVIGQLAEPGDVVLLSGALGAGKTCLTQGLAMGLGIDETTTSPTFVLMRQFRGRLPLYHVDLYRLEFAEITELGLDDYLNGEGVCAVEWAEKGLNLMPFEHLRIELEYLEKDNRRITLTPSGGRYQRLLKEFAGLWRTAGDKKL